MALDLTAATAVLKTKYTSEEVLNIASSKHPFFLNNLKQIGDFGGNGTMVVPVEFSNPQSIGGADPITGDGFVDVQASTASSSTAWAPFGVTRKLQYGLAKVHGLTMLVDDGDEDAFFQLADREWKNMFKEMGNRIAVHLYRAGTGSLGQRSTISVNTITLVDPRDARNWKKGMRLYASATDGGGTLRGAPDFTTVAAVNRGAGTVTVVSAAAIGGFVNSDFLFAARKDYDGTYTGLAAWLPGTDPSATTFFGVDRTVAMTELSGVRKAQVSGQTLEELAMDLATDIVDFGGTPDSGYMSPQNLNILAKQLGQKVIRQQGDDAVVGLGTITQNTDAGVITWYSDPDCPRTRMYLLQQDTWTLYHTKDFPHFAEEDGKAFFRKDAEDAYETRARAYGNLACRAPGYNGVAVLL